MHDSKHKVLRTPDPEGEAITLTGYQERRPVKLCAPVIAPQITPKGVRRSTMTPEQQAAHSLACAASRTAEKAARAVIAARERRKEQARQRKQRSRT